MATLNRPEMPILRETPDQIYQRMANRMAEIARQREQTPPATEEGEVFYDLLYPFALELSEQQQLLEYAFLQGFVPWADGDFLDAHGYLIGLDRTPDENDESYRQRLINRARTEEGYGRRTDYEAWALEIPGVGRCVAIEHERNDVSIDLYLTDMNDQPVTQEFADSVEASLWGTKRVAGHDLVAHPAPVYSVNVSVKILMSDETKRESAITLITQRINEYLKGRTSIIYQQIGALFLVDGVSDYTFYTLNGGSANLIRPAKAVSILTLVVS